MNSTTTPVPAVATNDHPTREQVDAVQRRYPTDPASATAIDLRYQRRQGPGWSPIGIDELVRTTTTFLSSRLEGPFTVRDAAWLTGGASKVQLAFTLDRTDPQQGPVSDRLLLRMDPPESLNTTDKQTEFEISRAVTGTVPAPDVLWVDPRGTEFPEPTLIYRFCSGATRPRATGDGAVTGLGTGFGPELRTELADQFVEHLAALHTFDPAGIASAAVTVPPLGTVDTAQWRLNAERTIWELDRGQDLAVMDVAASWMQRNLPVADRVGIVHGDFRSGNFLFDEDTRRITAWLDWELGHVGDRHEDLAYCTHPLFGAPAEDGTFLASGLLPPDELLTRYEQVSGLSVDRVRLDWYAMLCTYSALVRTLATPYRIARLGRSHQDILLARLEGVVPLLTMQLVHHLEKVI